MDVTSLFPRRFTPDSNSHATVLGSEKSCIPSRVLRYPIATFVERGACLHSVASRMRASAAPPTGQLTKAAALASCLSPSDQKREFRIT